MNAINRIFKMKPMAVAAASAVVLMATFIPVKNTYAGAVIGATEITQLMNNVELIGIYAQEAAQLVELVNSYKLMLEEATKLPGLIETNATNALMSLANSTKTGMALTYAAGNIAAEMDANFNSMADYETFLETADLDARAARFQDVLQTTYDTVEGALEAANLQMDMFDDEATALDAIQKQMKTAVGQNQILQAAGSIAAAQVEQMQKLRQLVMAQSNMQAAKMAAEADQRANDEAALKRSKGRSINIDPDSAQPITANDIF